MPLPDPNAVFGYGEDFFNLWTVSHNKDGTQGGYKFDPQFTWLGQALKKILAAQTESFGLSWLTDSTGDGNPSDWPGQLGTLIASANQAWTVRSVVFSDSLQSSFAVAPTVYRLGDAGVRFMRFVTASNSSLAIQKTDVGTYTNLDLQMDVQMDDWTPATAMNFASHFGAGGDRGWEFFLNTSGTIALQYSLDGSALLNKASTVVTGIADGTRKWIRVTFNGDNGAAGHDVKFWTSPDGITWTQLGTTVTTAGTGTIFNSSVVYELGARQQTTQVLTGNIYEVRLFKGLQGPATTATGVNVLNSATVNVGSTAGWPATGSFILGATDVAYTGVTATSFTGCGNHAATTGGEAITTGNVTPVAPCFPDQWGSYPNATNSPSPSGAPVLHLSVGAVASKSIVGGNAYLNDTTRMPKMLPDYNHKVLFLSSMHNDLEEFDAHWLTTYATWITNALPSVPNAVPVICTQNPKVSPAVRIREHSIRREKLLALGARLGYPVLDAYQAYLDLGSSAVYGTYIQADGIHPTITGSPTGMQVWANYAYAGLFP